MIEKIFLNHGVKMTGANASSPLPTDSFMSLIEMFNNILCTILGNCIS